MKALLFLRAVLIVIVLQDWACVKPVRAIDLPADMPQTDLQNFSVLWRSAPIIALGDIAGGSDSVVTNPMMSIVRGKNRADVVNRITRLQVKRVLRGSIDISRPIDVGCFVIPRDNTTFLKGLPLDRGLNPGLYVVFLAPGSTGIRCSQEVLYSAYTVSCMPSAKRSQSAEDVVASALLGSDENCGGNRLNEAAYLHRAVTFSILLTGYSDTEMKLRRLMHQYENSDISVEACLASYELLFQSTSCVLMDDLFRKSSPWQGRRRAVAISGRAAASQDLLWWITNRFDAWIIKEGISNDEKHRTEVLKYLAGHWDAKIRRAARTLIRNTR